MKNKKALEMKIEEIVKQICIEAQNNKFVTPIVYRQSIKLNELFQQELDKAYNNGRKSVLDEWNEEQKKLLQGFAYIAKLNTKIDRGDTD